MSLSVLLHADTNATSQGGVNECVFNLGRELTELGVRVEYLFGADSHGNHQTYLDGVPRPLRLYDPGIGALRLARTLKPLIGTYDVLHSHGSNAIFDAAIAMRLLGGGRTVSVATLHGTDHGVLASLRTELRLGHERMGLKQSALLAHFGLAVAKEHYAYKRIQALIARSPGVANEAYHWFGLPATPICPGTDTARFTPAIDAMRRGARARLGLGENELAVFAVGKPAYRKGTQYLAAAVRQAGPPFRLVTIGAEREIGAPDALALSTVPHDRLPPIYAACDIFCLPSTYEAFGLVLLDAMASGVACIATDTAGGRAMIRDGKNGLLVPRRNAPALVAALNHLRDPVLRMRLAAAAHETALQFTWRHEAKLTLAWYHELLEHRRRSADRG